MGLGTFGEDWKRESDDWVTVHPPVVYRSVYARNACPHGVKLDSPCVSCRAEFDAGLWVTPGSGVLACVHQVPVVLNAYDRDGHAIDTAPRDTAYAPRRDG